MKIDRRLFRCQAPFLLPLGLSVAFAVTAAALSAAQAWQLASLLAKAVHGQLTLDRVPQPFSLVLLLALAKALCTFASGRCGARSARVLKTHLRERLLAHHLSPPSLEATRTGDFLTLLMNGVEALDPYFRSYVPSLLMAVLIPVLFLAVVATADPLSALVMAVTAPLIPLFMFLIGKAAEQATARQWLTLTRMGTHFLDLIRGLHTLKALGTARDQLPKVTSSSEAFRRATLDVLRVAFLSALVLELVGTIATAFVAVQIGLRLLEGGLSLHLAFFVLLLAPEFYLPLRQLGLAFHSGMAGFDAASRIFAALPEEPRPSTAPPSAPLPSSAEPALLELREVTFSHPGRSPQLLDVSFQLNAGEHVGIVGPSGTGKSTLLALLLGFAEPQKGSIRLEGRECLDREAWRRRFAWVPQNPRLLSLSIADNIRLGRPEATLAEVEEAARMAQIHDVITALPKGYATAPGEGGIRLSSGEAQRVALARALLRQDAIFLLDEPSSALDLATEEAFEHVLRQVLGKRTAIVVAHRRGLLRHCHRVLRMAEGRIHEEQREADTHDG